MKIRESNCEHVLKKENSEGAIKAVDETKEQYKEAMATMSVEHDQRVRADEMLWDELNKVDSEAIEFREKTDKKFETFHNVLQDQTKSITEEFKNMGRRFDEQQRMMMKGFGMQPAGLQVTTSTTNEGTIVGDLNTSHIINSRKRTDTGEQTTGAKKRVTQNALGGAIEGFTARLRKLNELTSPVSGAQNITQTQATLTGNKGYELVDDNGNYDGQGYVNKNNV